MFSTCHVVVLIYSIVYSSHYLYTSFSMHRALQVPHPLEDNIDDKLYEPLLDVKSALVTLNQHLE